MAIVRTTRKAVPRRSRWLRFGLVFSCGCRFRPGRESKGGFFRAAGFAGKLALLVAPVGVELGVFLPHVVTSRSPCCASPLFPRLVSCERVISRVQRLSPLT